MTPNTRRTKKPRTKIPAQSSPRAILTTEQVIKIRARTLHDERTIRKWAAGGAVEHNTASRIESACGPVGAEVLG